VNIDTAGPFDLCFSREEKKLTAALGKLSGHFTGEGGETRMVQYLGLE